MKALKLLIYEIWTQHDFYKPNRYARYNSLYEAEVAFKRLKKCSLINGTTVMLRKIEIIKKFVFYKEKST